MKLLYKVLSLGLISFLTFSNISCNNPIEDLKITLNTDISTNNYGVRVIDAKNPDVAVQQLSIQIVGAGKKFIYNSDGTRIFNAENGIFSLLLEPGLKPSVENPVRFTILIESPGYLKAVFPVEINSEGNRAIDIPMVKFDAPPVGVASKTETVTVDATNGTTTSIKIVVPAENGKQEAAEISIPAGTKMLDEEGKPVTGTVSIEMVHFDNRNPESLLSFPGGFDASNVIGPNGQQMDPITFETAGFISVEMTSGNQKVKSFSNPISVKTELNAETINPVTGLAIAEGDTIPVWSLDTKTGQWKFEGNSNVTKNSSTNKLEATMTVPHLSWWNLDYFWNSCTYGSTVRFNTNVNSTSFRYMELVNANGSIYRYLFDNVANGSVLGLYRAPNGMRCRLRVYSGTSYFNKGTLIGQTPLFNLCGSNLQLSLTLPVPKIVNIDIAGNCEGNGRILRPSVYVYYKKVGNGSFNYLGYLNNGRMITDQFEIGQTYIFGTYYSGRWYEYTRTIDRTNYIETMSLPATTPGCR
jgi:hypothetical protein